MTFKDTGVVLFSIQCRRPKLRPHDYQARTLPRGCIPDPRTWLFKNLCYCSCCLLMDSFFIQFMTCLILNVTSDFLLNVGLGSTTCLCPLTPWQPWDWGILSHSHSWLGLLMGLALSALNCGCHLSSRLSSCHFDFPPTTDSDLESCAETPYPLLSSLSISSSQ